MAIRNWWLLADIDGYKNPMAGGPQSKDGGFRLEVHMRENGQRVLPLVITGEANKGKLSLCVDMAKDFRPDNQQRQPVYVLETER